MKITLDLSNWWRGSLRLLKPCLRALAAQDTGLLAINVRLGLGVIAMWPFNRRCAANAAPAR